MQRRSIPIPSRAIEALFKTLGKMVPGTMLGAGVIAGTKEPRHGSYEGEDLIIRAMRWFDQRYGRAQALDFRLGKVVTAIRGAPWLIIIPLVRGSLRLYASIERSPARKPGLSIARNGPIVINAVDHVKGLPDQLRRCLTPHEQAIIFRDFKLALNFGRFDLTRDDMLEVAFDDLERAADEAVTNHYGQSRWSSLQAIEKLYKVYLTTNNRSYGKRHILSELHESAHEIGIDEIPTRWLDLVQCSAGLRYGEPSSLREAVVAQHAALRVAGRILQHI